MGGPGSPEADAGAASSALTEPLDQRMRFSWAYVFRCRRWDNRNTGERCSSSRLHFRREQVAAKTPSIPPDPGCDMPDGVGRCQCMKAALGFGPAP